MILTAVPPLGSGGLIADWSLLVKASRGEGCFNIGGRSLLQVGVVSTFFNLSSCLTSVGDDSWTGKREERERGKEKEENNSKV